jgi:drug/metabolite transporter (DMT)-like permease
MDKTIISVLAGLGGMFGWGVSDFFANLSSAKVGHFKAFFWSQLAGIVLTLCLVPFFGLNTNLSFVFVLLLFVTAIFYSVGYLLFYKAFEIGNVSIVSATINLNVIIAMLLAIIFVGQRLTPFQLFAVFLVLVGVTLVSVNFKDLKNKEVKLLAGVKETVLASVFFGVFWNLSEYISEKIGWLPTTLYIKVGAILFLLLFASYAKRKLELSKTPTKVKLMVALVGVLEAAAVASVNWGLAFGDLVLVSPISSALSVVTITMAVVFLKEKITKTQALGIVTTIVGIVLTAL